MSIGSAAANVTAMTGLTGLTHDIFVGDVVNNVKRDSPVANLFIDASAGEDYRLEGQNMVFAVDLTFKVNAMATSGKLPGFTEQDAAQGKITPTRRYAPLAVDNLVEKRASGPGAFEPYAERIVTQMWDSWHSMEMRQSIGASTGYVCLCSSRTSSTVFVAKDGYGHAGTNPVMNLAKNAFIAWYDVSAAGFGGAGKISSINESTNAVTMDSATTWEPSAQIAAGDYILISTCGNISTDYFDTEKDVSPNGVGTIVDIDAALTQVFNISQSTWPRWKPYRQASSTFDHLEVTEHWRALGSKRGFTVNPNDDVAVCHGGPLAQLARTLMGFQQQAYTGEMLKGGYTGVGIAGMPIVQDDFFYHDAFVTLHRPALYRVNLGGDADFWGEDGSMWSRIAQFDGKEAFARDYVNYFSTHRGAHGAITSIVTADVTDTLFDPVANY